MTRLALVVLVLAACSGNTAVVPMADAAATVHPEEGPGGNVVQPHPAPVIPDAAPPPPETRAEKRARLAAEAKEAREQAAEERRVAREQAAADKAAAREQAAAERAAELEAAREEGRHEGRVESITALRAHIADLGVEGLDFSTRGPNDTILSIHSKNGCGQEMLNAFLKMQDPAHPLSSAGFTSVECAGGPSLSLR